MEVQVDDETQKKTNPWFSQLGTASDLPAKNGGEGRLFPPPPSLKSRE